MASNNRPAFDEPTPYYSDLERYATTVAHYKRSTLLQAAEQELDTTLTYEDAVNAANIAVAYPNLPSGVVSAATLGGLAYNSPQLAALALRQDAVDEQSAFDEIMGAVRGVVRGAITGAWALVDAYDQPFRWKAYVDQGVDPAEAWVKAAGGAQMAIADMLRGRPVNIGSGFMPEGDRPETDPTFAQLVSSGVPRDVALADFYKRRGRPHIVERIDEHQALKLNVGGQVVENPTFGRWLAGHVFDSDTKPFTVASGIADFAKQMADPAAIVAGKVSQVRNTRRVFATPGAVIDEGTGIVGQVRKILNKSPDPTTWLRSEEGQGFVKFIRDINDVDLIHQLMPDMPAKGKLVLAQLDDADEISNVLGRYFGREVSAVPTRMSGKIGRGVGRIGEKLFDNVPSGLGKIGGMRAVAGWRWTETPLGRAFMPMHDARVDITDIDNVFTQVRRFLVNAGVDRTRREQILRNIAVLEPGDTIGVFRVVDDSWRAWFDQVRKKWAWFDKDGRLSQLLEARMYDSVLFSRNSQARLYAHLKTGQPMPLSAAQADMFMEFEDGRKALKAFPQLMTELQERVAFLPDPYEVLRMQSRIRNVTDRLFRARDPLLWREGPIEKLLDQWMVRAFKPLVLLRPAWTVRVISEEMARLAAASEDALSVFTHPIEYLGYALSDVWRNPELGGVRGLVRDGAKRFGVDLGEFLKGRFRVVSDGVEFLAIDEAYEFQKAQSRMMKNLLSSGQRGGVQHSPQWQVVLRDHPNFYRYHAGDLLRQAGDPMTRRIAREGPDAIEEWMLNSPDGIAFRKQFKASLADDHPWFDIDVNPDTVRDFIESRQAYLHDRTGGKVLHRRGDRWYDQEGQRVPDELVPNEPTGRFTHIVEPGDERLIAQIAAGTLAGFDVSKQLSRKQLARLVEKLEKDFGDVLPSWTKGPASLQDDATFGSYYDSIVQNLFRLFGEKPTNYFNRSPMFRYRYWARIGELFPGMAPRVQKQVLEAAEHANTVDTMLRHAARTLERAGADPKTVEAYRRAATSDVWKRMTGRKARDVEQRAAYASIVDFPAARATPEGVPFPAGHPDAGVEGRRVVNDIKFKPTIHHDEIDELFDRISGLHDAKAFAAADWDELMRLMDNHPIWDHIAADDEWLEALRRRYDVVEDERIIYVAGPQSPDSELGNFDRLDLSEVGELGAAFVLDPEDVFISAIDRAQSRLERLAAERGLLFDITNPETWDEAFTEAVEKAAKSLKDARFIDIQTPLNQILRGEATDADLTLAAVAMKQGKPLRFFNFDDTDDALDLLQNLYERTGGPLRLWKPPKFTATETDFVVWRGKVMSRSAYEQAAPDADIVQTLRAFAPPAMGDVTDEELMDMFRAAVDMTRAKIWAGGRGGPEAFKQRVVQLLTEAILPGPPEGGAQRARFWGEQLLAAVAWKKKKGWREFADAVRKQYRPAGMPLARARNEFMADLRGAKNFDELIKPWAEALEDVLRRVDAEPPITIPPGLFQMGDDGVPKSLIDTFAEMAEEAGIPTADLSVPDSWTTVGVAKLVSKDIRKVMNRPLGHLDIETSDRLRDVLIRFTGIDEELVAVVTDPTVHGNRANHRLRSYWQQHEGQTFVAKVTDNDLEFTVVKADTHGLVLGYGDETVTVPWKELRTFFKHSDPSVVKWPSFSEIIDTIPGGAERMRRLPVQRLAETDPELQQLVKDIAVRHLREPHEARIRQLLDDSVPDDIDLLDHLDELREAWQRAGSGIDPGDIPPIFPNVDMEVLSALPELQDALGEALEVVGKEGVYTRAYRFPTSWINENELRAQYVQDLLTDAGYVRTDFGDVVYYSAPGVPPPPFDEPSWFGTQTARGDSGLMAFIAREPLPEEIAAPGSEKFMDWWYANREEILNAGGRISDGRIDSVYLADEIARADALDDVQELLYDLSRKSTWAAATRHLFPFAEAFAEVWSRWLGLTSRYMNVPRRVSQLYTSAWTGGTIYTDDYGQKRFAYPGQRWVAALLDKTGTAGAVGVGAAAGGFVGGPLGAVVGGGIGAALGNTIQDSGALEDIQKGDISLGAPVSGLNLAMNSLGPGFGPAPILAADLMLPKLENHLPAGVIQHVEKVLFPYGRPSSRSGPLGYASVTLPSWMKRAVAMLQDDAGLFDDSYVRATNDLLAIRRIKEGRGPRSEKEAEEWVKAAQSEARGLAAIMAIGASILPAPPSAEHRIPIVQNIDDAELEADHPQYITLRGLVTAWHRFLAAADGDSVLAGLMFEQTFGFDAAATRPLTWSKMPRPSQTQGYEFWLENQDLFDRNAFGRTAYYAEPDIPGGLFEPAAWERQRREGVRTWKNPDEYLRDMETFAARQFVERLYRKVPEEAQKGEGWRQYRAQVGAVVRRMFPLAFNQIGPKLPSLEEKYEELQRWEMEPRLANTDVGQAVMKMNAAMRAVEQQVVAQLGLSPIRVGVSSDWTTSTKTQELRERLVQFGTQLAQETPEFLVVWQDVYLPKLTAHDPDPWMPDASLVGSLQQPIEVGGR